MERETHRRRTELEAEAAELRSKRQEVWLSKTCDWKGVSLACPHSTHQLQTRVRELEQQNEKMESENRTLQASNDNLSRQLEAALDSVSVHEVAV